MDKLGRVELLVSQIGRGGRVDAIQDVLDGLFHIVFAEIFARGSGLQDFIVDLEICKKVIFSRTLEPNLDVSRSFEDLL